MFKIGDKVRLRADYATGKQYGYPNRVTLFPWMVDAVVARGTRNTFTIEKIDSGRNTAWLSEVGYLWHLDMFELAEASTIVIETHNRTVVAKRISDGRVVKSGVAKCCPEDTFDAYEGAKLALDRLFDKAPQYKKPNPQKAPVVGHSHTDKSPCTCAIGGCRTSCDAKTTKTPFPYKVGDKVVIVDKFTRDCHVNLFGRMDKWQGKIMTIAKIETVEDADHYWARMVEDHDENGGDGWAWSANAIKCKATASYKVGDRVVIVDRFTRECRANPAGAMDKYLGTVMTIVSVDDDGDFKMKEDNCDWWWNTNCFKGLAPEVSKDEESEDEGFNAFLRQMMGDIMEALIKDSKEAPVEKDEENPVEDIEKLLSELFGTGKPNPQSKVTENRRPKSSTPYRAVQRAANRGEYIQIVKADHLYDSENYSNGDIGVVEKRYQSDASDIEAFGGQWIGGHEYVVLEGFTPLH